MTSLLNIAGNATTDAFAEGSSLRFEDGDSAYLSWTPASAGNRKTWTWSGWVKRANLGVRQTLFSTSNSAGNDYLGVEFQTGDTLLVGGNNGSASVQVSLTSNAVFRDTSAWYHIVISFDTTQSTSTNRVKVYVNGVLQTFSSATYPPLNYDSRANTTNQHNLGSFLPAAGLYVDGYLANVAFIDGTALTPTSFGEYEDTLWKPKSDADITSLTMGTNGFYLAFEDSSAIGDDTSGNANDWTANNLVATDVVPDSPVTNFPTLNALTYSGAYALTLSEGNLVAREATGDATWKSLWSTFAAPTSGKWYAEFYLTYTGSTAFTYQAFAGLHDGLAATTYIGQSSGSYGYLASGGTYNNATHTTSYGASYGSGDIVGVAWDADNGDLTFYKNGVSQGTAYSSVSAENKFFGVSAIWISPDGQTFWHCNFGQDSSFAGNETPQGNTDDNGQGDFYYAPPSGFLALTRNNLPSPDILDPADYFNTVLWTGDGSAQSITGVGFQPDFVWTKSRNNSYNHLLYDAVRGATSGSTDTALYSSTADYENTYGILYHNLASFDADGFTTGLSTSTDVFNSSGLTQVSWNWLADTAFSNSAGTNGADLASTGHVNQDAGFSIVSFDLEATGSKTVLHGLSSAPEMIIVKSRDAAALWVVYTEPTGNTTYLSLNDDAGATTNSTTWDNTSPTSSVFTLGSGFTTANYGTRQIAYCFHSVEGYSKIGSYTGSTSLPFVHCGFRPSFLIVKRLGATDSGWLMVDSKRNSVNVVDANLFPNVSLAENSITGFLDADFLANGFKLRTSNAASNASGEAYLFYAVAEAPFKNANAR